MGTQTIEQTFCDHCDRPPNGDSPDCVYHLSCGHDICNECKHTALKKHKSPCPICRLAEITIGRPQ